MSLTELEREVKKLSPTELAEFARWMDTFTSEQWEQRFEADVAAGKLNSVGKKADEDFDRGSCSEL